MIRKILALCSRDQGHEEVYSLLRSYLAAFDSEQGSWDSLIFEAEKQGIAPLLYKHIVSSEYAVPSQARRLLQTLYLRNKRSNEIRNKIVAGILAKFKQNGITVILMKGIVLSNCVYKDYASRPMRDIDLLVDKRDVPLVQEVLGELGFYQEDHPDIGEDHHHLEPFVKKVDGLPISIEVHRELLPEEYNDPGWSFENLSSSLETFSFHDTKAQTLGLEKMLHYLYLHGLRSPLMYEPYRLIHVADLVSFVECNYEQIDWEQLAKSLPSVIDILSRLHYLTPWNRAVQDYLTFDLSHPPASPGIPYCGWPLRSPKEIPFSEMVQLFKDTMWPPQWWLQVYYGQIKNADYFSVRFFEHPRAIWRLIKTYRRAQKSF